MPNVIAIPILAGIFVFGLILGAIIRKGSVGYWPGATDSSCGTLVLVERLRPNFR